MRAVVADANGLLMPFQFKFNLQAELQRVMGECELLVPSSVMWEMRKLAERIPEARTALSLVESLKASKGSIRARVVETTLPGDEAVLQLSVLYRAPALTSDKELICKLQAHGMPVIRLKAGRYLEISGAL